MSKPIFIFSLPRSGSTLLQRILTSTDECASHSEPSFLLRLLGSGGILDRSAAYSEELVEKAFEDMEDEFPGYVDLYHQGVADLAQRLYDHAGAGHVYFVDKTPRYSLIASEIIKCFPDAKFIFLWRNPGSVMSSITNTWNKGIWNVEYYKVDLIHGTKSLYRARDLAGSRAVDIRYEDLVSNPQDCLSELADYLELPTLLSALDKPLPEKKGGTLGDQRGSRKYTKISADSLHSWKQTCNNWYRRRSLKKIIDQVPEYQKHYSNEELSLPQGKCGFFAGLRDMCTSLAAALKIWIRPRSLKVMLKHRVGLKSSISYR